MKVKKTSLYKKTNIPFKNGMPSWPNKVPKSAEKIAAIKEALKVGRPAINVDWDRVYRLAKIHATPEEIGWVLGYDPDSLRLRPEFPTVYRKGWEGGKKSLRRAQFNAALGTAPYTDKNGNKREGRPPSVSMMIWLGKQILRQSDKIQVGGDEDNPITVLHEHNHKVDYAALSVKELETLQALLLKAQGGGSSNANNGANVIDVTPIKMKSKVNGKVHA